MHNVIYFLDKVSAPIMELNKLFALVSQTQRTKYNVSGFKNAMLLSIYAELIVRWRACEILKISNVDVHIGRNEFGKPYLANYPDFHFNISHTKDAVVVIFSLTSVGVDIERVNQADMRIARRFFTGDECKYIEDSLDKDAAFYDVWTRKEAYIKCLGKGLSILLPSFSVFDATLSQGFATMRYEQYMISYYGANILPANFIHITEKELLTHANEYLTPLT
jgi:4'-phosphopantetheinyl transferase